MYVDIFTTSLRCGDDTNRNTFFDIPIFINNTTLGRSLLSFFRLETSTTTTVYTKQQNVFPNGWEWL